MRTSWPTTGSFLAWSDILDETSDVFWPCCVLLDDRDSTDPLVTREFSQIIPFFRCFWMRFECLCHVSGDFIVMWCACEDVHTLNYKKIYPNHKAEIRWIFLCFGRRLIRYSSLLAVALSGDGDDRASLTGLRDLVYFAPLGLVLCSRILRSRSLVIPV